MLEDKRNKTTDVLKVEDKIDTPADGAIENCMNPPVDVEGVVINCERLNLRSQPEKDPKNIITTLKEGAVLRVENVEGDDEWLKVWTAAGVEGYVSADYILIK